MKRAKEIKLGNGRWSIKRKKKRRTNLTIARKNEGKRSESYRKKSTIS